MNKNNNITFIHIIAALLVMFGHQFNLIGMVPPTIMGIDPHGLGVRILFLISGYLVSGSYLRSGKRGQYIFKRLTRLYPSLIICLIVTVVCLYPFSSLKQGYWKSALDYIIYNLRMYPRYNLADLFSTNPYPASVNGSLWTLPVEIACYILLIPVTDLFCYIKKRNRLIAAGIMTAILFVLSGADIIRMLYHADKHAPLYGTDWLMALNLAIWFLIGISFRLFQLEKYCNWQAALVASLIFELSTGVFSAFLLPYVISYDVMCFALPEKPLFANTFKHDICYGLYLYAFPVQQLLIYLLYAQLYVHIGLPLSAYILYGLSVVVTWLLAELNYRFVEAPCAKLFDRLMKDR